MADARSRLEEILRQQQAIEATEPQRMAELTEYFAEQNRIKTKREDDRFWLNFWLSVTATIIALVSLLISLR